MKAVKFFNHTKEDFSWKWDGDLYTFKSGESTMLQEPIAWHFAKHLAVRELNKKTGQDALVNPQNMQPLMKSFIVEEGAVEAETETQLEVAVLNEKKEVKEPKEAKKGMECCGSKGTRHKKGCEALVAETPKEEEFEGLNE